MESVWVKEFENLPLKACAKLEAATDGDAFVRLVVTFLRRTPRCIIAARDGELLPIKEIGPDGRSSIGLPLLLTDGGVLSTCNVNTESELSMEVKMKGLEHRFRNTYSIVRDFVLGVDHATVHESRFAEQMIFPFFPPLFVCLSNEEGRDPV